MTAPRPFTFTDRTALVSAVWSAFGLTWTDEEVDRVIRSLEANRWHLRREAADAQAVGLPTVDVLAHIIRKVDGDHSLGAAALAYAILEAVAA